MIRRRIPHKSHRHNAQLQFFRTMFDFNFTDARELEFRLEWTWSGQQHQQMLHVDGLGIVFFEDERDPETLNFQNRNLSYEPKIGVGGDPTPENSVFVRRIFFKYSSTDMSPLSSHIPRAQTHTLHVRACVHKFHKQESFIYFNYSRAPDLTSRFV